MSGSRNTASKIPDLEPRKVPVQSRARERVEAIVDAAAELLVETPVSELSTSAIAERARVPIGSVYQYFPNKMAVLAALARRVMAEVDERTVKEIAKTHALPWQEGVDRAVEVTIEAFGAQRGYAPLLRAIHATVEFRQITGESNAKVASALAAHPQFAGLGLPPERVEAITRTAIEAANALQDLALTADGPARAQLFVAEMKTLLKAYLGHYQGRLGKTTGG